MTDARKPRKSSRPTIRERAADAICPNCGTSTADSPRKTFCGPKCRTEHQNRGVARGAALTRWAQAWRADRGSGEIAKGAFDQMCRMIDEWNGEDSAAGRPRPDLWAARMLLDDRLYLDRQNRTARRRASQPVEAQP